MRILYFAPHKLIPLTTGSRLRDYHLAGELAKGADVTFVEMPQAGEQRSLAPADCGFQRVVSLDKPLTYTPAKILRGLAGPTPVTLLNCWSSRMASEFAGVLHAGRFDTVQIEGVHLMKYLPIIQQAPGCPAIIVDWHNIESELMWRYAKTPGNWARKMAAMRTATLIERAEGRLLDCCAMHTVTSEREKQKLLARRPRANIHVIQNGVDTGDYSRRQIGEASRRTASLPSRSTILFVGSMDYSANIDGVTWFAKSVWPEIARQHPALHFQIVGRNPDAKIRSLASERVHVTGTVEDVRPFYASALAVVVPLRAGSGTRLKILEAMAAEVPVLSTRLGAEGIEAEHNVHLLLADSGREMVQGLRQLAASAETRDRLSAAARSLVVRRYDWSSIGPKLHRIHRDLLGRPVDAFARTAS